MDGIFMMNTKDIDYLYKDLYVDGKLQIKPYSYYKDLDRDEVRQFCVKEGIYCLPTTELVEFLKTEIGDSRALEIGSGNGAIAEALEIRATDNKMQSWSHIKERYDLLKQGTVQYGQNVDVYDGMDAVRRFKPKTVISAWVTHKYNPKQHYREGNMYGVDEQKVLDRIEKYIFIGNTHTHRHKPILDNFHRTIKPEWLVSRVWNDKDVIWVWEK